MRNKYPYQGHVRFANKDEKAKAQGFAKKNGLSLSAAGRLLFIRAMREGWTLEMGPKRKSPDGV